MDIRLIAVDLDGTLLTSAREVHPAGAAALREAAGRGLAICLASGRNAASIKPFMVEAGIDGAIVSCNGAFVLGQSGEELLHVELPEEPASIVFEYCLAEGVQVVLYSKDRVYLAEESEWSRLYLKRVRNLEPHRVSWEALTGLHRTKLLLIDAPERIDLHRARLAEQVDPSTANAIVSEPEYLEFVAPGTNKLTGLRLIAERAGLNSSQVAAIGDYENDIEMLGWAGYSGAVDNAPDIVKVAAGRVFASNNEGGVAEFVKSIVYNE